MALKNVPAWLKGGIIADVLFLFLLFALEFWIRFLRAGIENILGFSFYKGTAEVVLGFVVITTRFLYGIPFLIVFILGTIVGAISGKIFANEKNVVTKGSRIGFWLGIICALLLFVISIIDRYYSRTFGLTKPFHGPTLELLRIPWLVYLLPFILPIVLGWIGWILGGLFNNHKK